VRITDKIAETFDVVNKMFNCSGEYLYDGKFVDKDSTFLDLQIPNGAKFLQPVGGGISLKNVTKWFRMEYYEHNYTNGMSTNWEGCVFAPKNRPIWFAGIGLHRRRNEESDVVIQMTWNVGDERGEFPEIEINIPELEEFEIKEKKYMEFDFCKNGVRPVLIQQDEPLHIALKSVSGNREFCYGYYGERSATIPD